MSTGPLVSVFPGVVMALSGMMFSSAVHGSLGSVGTLASALLTTNVFSSTLTLPNLVSYLLASLMNVLKMSSNYSTFFDLSLSLMLVMRELHLLSCFV